MAQAKKYKVKALVNIKYDKAPIKAGKEFKAKKDDVSELVEKGYVELLEEFKEDEGPKDGDAGDKEGEE